MSVSSSASETIMTPDLKRLCDAADHAVHRLGFKAFPDVQEAIVRAVLEELREVDIATLFQAQIRANQSAGLGGELNAMIDCILGTSATA